MNSDDTTREPSIRVREADWERDCETLERLRTTVFVLEQGVPRQIEWDGRDREARHVIAEVDGEAVGCGRLLAEGRIGRLAVLAEHRGTGLGGALLDALLLLAQRQGLSGVYLHAQEDAVGFYARAGFRGDGTVFEEAGIRHCTMLRDLDYRDWNETITRLGYPQPFAQLVIAQARLARRELRILSPGLDTRVFEDEQLFSALRGLLRRTRQAQVKILIADARALVERGHGLLSLARRLPSGMEMRCLAEHPDWNGDTLVLRDRDSVLAQPASESDPGSYRPGDRGRGQGAVARFEELWRAGSVDPNLRALSL
jgi:predicted GNAT family N-acyltransferase